MMILSASDLGIKIDFGDNEVGPTLQRTHGPIISGSGKGPKRNRALEAYLHAQNVLFRY